jgi:Fur family transcriptional regulator, ferric uptake regulator
MRLHMISNKNDMLETQEARAILSGAGRRTTSQRALILDVLSSASGHLDADEVYRLAKERDPRLSLSTVYRTLGLLKQLGQVSEVHLSEEHHHYEVTPGSQHYHLVCMGCGRVVEFQSALADELRVEQERSSGFMVSVVSMDLKGYCPDCQARGLPDPGPSAAGASEDDIR